MSRTPKTKFYDELKKSYEYYLNDNCKW